MTTGFNDTGGSVMRWVGLEQVPVAHAPRLTLLRALVSRVSGTASSAMRAGGLLR